ncbi:hypothetical protein QC764_0013920 [Podospora pseudoanserina]|uniref:Uncharacterized protein n=1 Tax=Podospora pseudoanserina TaxID=2609844 RepID=A0ABR0IP85_9PEZI|nr:hypothetical protein QC764_0013920 [Podospora pseudoanserina]
MTISVWYYENCLDGPYNTVLDIYCANCNAPRNSYCNVQGVPPPRSLFQPPRNAAVTTTSSTTTYSSSSSSSYPRQTSS